jgi:hypothetical protein
MHYKVFAVNQFGRKIIVGEGLKGASEARAASRLISREFGLRERPASRTESSDINFLSSEA